MKITEEEIRPEKIFDEYLRLTRNDIETFFAHAERTDINCPACNGSGKEWVRKQGFVYKECTACQSIFVSPRPVRAAYDAYYKDSPSTEYWATTFYKVTEAARRAKLWKPKARLIADKIQEFKGGEEIRYIVDIGGGYGVFDEEISLILPDTEALVIEPSVHLADICRQKGFRVIEKFMEDIGPMELPKGRKCFVSFELFEHLHEPQSFLQTVLAGMEKNDLFIFTTLSGMGVDIRVLGEHSKTLSPPHHLNFLNPKSISLLLANTGFTVLEAFTPGKLDMDIIKKNAVYVNDPFWKPFLSYASDAELDLFQDFIAGAGFSSHMMIVCRK
jgi:hypothetical protein